MAIKRKLENETPEQRDARILKETIANHATRSEKTSWGRKRLNLEKLIAKEIRPREDRIMEMQAELREFYDQIKELRDDMVESCVHPFDHLVINSEGAVFCKFCGKTMTKVTNG